MREMMNTLEEGLVEFQRNAFSVLWAQTDDSFSLKILVVLLAFGLYSNLARKHFLLLQPTDVSDRRQKDWNQTKKKKVFLDRLAAVSVNREAVPGVDGQEVVVSFGDVTGPELLTNLIAKTEQKTPGPLTVTVQFSVKISDSGIEKLKGSLKQLCVEGEEHVTMRWLHRARTLQGKVELRGSILHELESLYKIASEFDEGCTLQVDSWGILKGEGGWQLKVLDKEMPVILHAEYAAGILTITGKHLEGAEVKLANDHDSIKLDGRLKVQEMKFRVRGLRPAEVCIDYWKLPVRLSTQEIDDVLVYATKNREVDGQPVVIYTKAVQVKDASWNTVFQRWILQNFVLVFFVVQLTRLLSFSFTWIKNSSGLFNAMFFTVTMIKFCFSKPCWPEYCRNASHGFVRAVWTMYFGAVDLICREPHLSYSAGRKSSPRSSSERPPKHADPSPSMINISTSPKACVNSILKQQKGENNISEAWEPCIVEQVKVSGLPVLRKVQKEGDDFDAENNPFVVIYKKADKRPWAEEVMVQVASEHLISILQKHLPFHGQAFCSERPEVPGGDIFVVVDSLSVEGAGIKEHQLRKAQLHLDLLVRYIKKEYKDVSVRLERMKQERLASYDLLWALFYPGQKVAYKCQYTETLLCATVAERLVYLSSHDFVKLRLDVYDFNGRVYKNCNIIRDISKFDGERVFESLPVCPVTMMSRPQEVLEAEFVAHGRRYYELAITQSYRFMSYQGPIFCPQRRSKFDFQSRRSAQENADGRVMIDTLRFVSMNPGFKMFGVEPSSQRMSRMSKHSSDQFEDYMSLAIPEDLSDEKLMFAPGVVFGFSFVLKQWGLFKVSGFSDVVFDANAFDELVMEPEDKSLIYSIVSQYVAEPQQQLHGIDPISKKGDGCIIVCYGPPGTGKTLTAESVAENLRRPLWALSLSQLGTAPEELESSLSGVLSAASLWQAIILLDEADIFLEKRSNCMDLGRNAMIGVFLRQLEYYRGIMFLTTNRVSAIDEAVRSRVSMLVCYPQLGATQRGQVWRSLLSRAGLHDDSTSDDLNALDLNGREIRNVIHTAQVWAKSKNEPLQIDHVKYVLEVFTKSIRTLEDAVDDSCVF